MLDIDLISAMALSEFRPDFSIEAEGRMIDKNADKLTKSYVSPLFAAGLVFSHGRFILDAGYDTAFTDLGAFSWEEPY